MNKIYMFFLLVFFSCSSTKKVTSFDVKYDVEVQDKGDYVTPISLTVLACNEFTEMNLQTKEGLNIITVRQLNKQKFAIYLQYNNLKAKITDLDEWTSIKSNMFKYEITSSDNFNINSKSYKTIKYSYSYNNELIAQIIALENYNVISPILIGAYGNIKEIPIQITYEGQKKTVFKVTNILINRNLMIDDVTSYSEMTINEFLELVNNNNNNKIKIDFIKLFYLFQP